MKKLIYLTILLSLFACTKDGYEEFQRDNQTSFYQYDFEIKVGNKLVGRIDSVILVYNGRYFKDEIPFYFGTNDIPEYYYIVSNPDFEGICYTQVHLRGVMIERFTHRDGETGILSGSTE